MNLVKLDQGQSAKILSIEGGESLAKKLNNLGIKEGMTVKKVTGLFTHGPIVVKVGSTQIALGRGMAAKVIVEAL